MLARHGDMDPGTHKVLGLVLLVARTSASKDVELLVLPRGRHPAPHQPTTTPGLGEPGVGRRLSSRGADR
jgi:hypothetical protein